MDQPKIPTLKDAQKPQVKIKGMGAGVTLFDRLKQFKKKDLAFILAGLGTLFMAPLAEHFMMAPENGASDLSSGFRGSGGGKDLFGSGSSPYESGNNLASGGAIGGGGDIITPLNVRDPSALVMGPGAAQQPPAGSVAPPVAPPATKSDPDYAGALKDSVAGAATRAAKQAVSHSLLPVPKVALGGSGLRGLGVAGGGTSASGGGGPIGPAAGSVGNGGGDRMYAKGGPNFRGAAGPRSPTGPGGLDGTKKAGQNAGDQFSRTGSALGGLNSAANEQIPTGGSGSGGGGLGGAGANDKGPGGSGAGGSKSVGESLAFIEAKERMMENLKYEFEMRKLKDPQRLMYEIRNESLKAMASELTKTLTKGVVGLFDGSAAAKSGVVKCPGMPDVPQSSVKSCADDKEFGCFNVSNGIYFWRTGPTTGVSCSLSGGAAADGTGTKTEGGAVSELSAALGDVCTKINATTGGKGDYDAYLKKDVLTASKNAELARNTLVSGGDTKCGSTPVTGDSASKMLVDAKAMLFAAAAAAPAGGAAAPAEAPAEAPAGGAAAPAEGAAATDALGLIKATASKDDVKLAVDPAKALEAATKKIKAAQDLIDTIEKNKLLDPVAPVVKTGTDQTAFDDVTKQVGRVSAAQNQAKVLAKQMSDSAKALNDQITAIGPLVKDSAKPVGALPDQISLNKAGVDLEKEAKASELKKSVVDMTAAQAVKAEVIKEQKDTVTALGGLKSAIDTAADSAAAAKAKPDDTDLKKKADTDKTALDKALTDSKTSVTASQTALLKVEATRETDIQAVVIRTTP
jgi:hypothetical protein